MKKTTSLLALAVTLLGGIVYYNTSESPNLEPQEEAPTPTVTFTGTSSAAVETRADAPVAPSKEPPDLVKAKIKKYQIGKGPEYRAELKKDPHQTPDVAITAALELGEIFDSVKTETDAGEAFEFFANCVSAETVISLQVSCLRYARRLSENYPALVTLWSSLEASASDDVKSVLKFDQR